MRWFFRLPGTRAPLLRLERSFWTGRVRLYANGREVARARGRRNRFVIELADGSPCEVLVKPRLLRYLPRVAADGREIRLDERGSAMAERSTVPVRGAATPAGAPADVGTPASWSGATTMGAGASPGVAGTRGAAPADAPTFAAGPAPAAVAAGVYATAAGVYSSTVVGGAPRPAGARSPWVSMWTRPRATVSALVETEPERAVLLLAALAGIAQVLDRASFRSMGDVYPLSTIVLAAAIAGSLSGVAALYVAALGIGWSGRWLGGYAPREHIRAALAWGGLPTAAGLALWAPALLVFGAELFTTETPLLDESPGLALLLASYGFASIALQLWATVLALKALGEVQGFSAWRALANVVLAGIVLLAPIIGLGFLAAVLIPMLAG